jgi:hypothetical protein
MIILTPNQVKEIHEQIDQYRMLQALKIQIFFDINIFCDGIEFFLFRECVFILKDSKLTEEINFEDFRQKYPR